jgi:hypothetical protein
MRLLHQYDNVKDDIKMLETIPMGSSFAFGKHAKVYIKGNTLRTRIVCTDVVSKAKYLFNPTTNVKLIQATLF